MCRGGWYAQVVCAGGVRRWYAQVVCAGGVRSIHSSRHTSCGDCWACVESCTHDCRRINGLLGSRMLWQVHQHATALHRLPTTRLAAASLTFLQKGQPSNSYSCRGCAGRLNWDTCRRWGLCRRGMSAAGLESIGCGIDAKRHARGRQDTAAGSSAWWYRGCRRPAALALQRTTCPCSGRAAAHCSVLRCCTTSCPQSAAASSGPLAGPCCRGFGSACKAAAAAPSHFIHLVRPSCDSRRFRQRSSNLLQPTSPRPCDTCPQARPHHHPATSPPTLLVSDTLRPAALTTP